jgi:hypothetical protein
MVPRYGIGVQLALAGGWVAEICCSEICCQGEKAALSHLRMDF